MKSEKKFSQKEIREAIVKEAIKLKKKRELFKEAKTLSNKLKLLNEQGFVGSYGFDSPNDKANETKTGFVNNEGPARHISQTLQELENEMYELSQIDEEFGDEYNPTQKADDLQAENEKLKKQLEAIKKTLKDT